MRRRIIISVLGSSLLVLAACAGSGSGTEDDVVAAPVAEVPETTVSSGGGSSPGTSGITVSGVGSVVGQPDTMTVTIGVNVVRPTVSEATSEAAESATALIDALTGAGVAEEDIQTQNFSIWPQYAYPEGDAPRLTGYQVSNTVVAKIRDVETAGAVIDAAVAAGGDNSVVQGVGFSVEDDTERLAEARAKAFADARAKAEQLAELAGVELGAVIRMTETIGSTAVPYGTEMAAADASGTPIQGGSVTSDVQIEVVFAIG